MLCPLGSDSWCQWRKAEADRSILDQFEHDPPLDEDVAAALVSIYEDLCDKNLLETCLGSKIQNNNESFKLHCLATRIKLKPKHLLCGVEITLEIHLYVKETSFLVKFHREKLIIFSTNRLTFNEINCKLTCNFPKY